HHVSAECNDGRVVLQRHAGQFGCNRAGDDHRGSQQAQHRCPHRHRRPQLSSHLRASGIGAAAGTSKGVGARRMVSRRSRNSSATTWASWLLRTSLVVTNTMISDRFLTSLFWLSRSPRYLTWLRPGSPDTVRSSSSLIRPPSSTVWPLLVPTVEWIRRCEIVGVRFCAPLPLGLTTLEISCSISSSIDPFGCTCGSTFRMMPVLCSG